MGEWACDEIERLQARMERLEAENSRLCQERHEWQMAAGQATDRALHLEHQVQAEVEERNRFRGLWQAARNRETYARLPDGLEQALAVGEELQRDLFKAGARIADLERELAALRLERER